MNQTTKNQLRIPLLVVIVTAVIVFGILLLYSQEESYSYSDFGQRVKERITESERKEVESKESSQATEKKEPKAFLEEINKAVNLMDTVKDKMPKELREVHQFLLKEGEKNEIRSL